MSEETIKHLEAQLRKAKELQRQEDEARKAATPVRRQFTIEPVEPRDSFDQIYDDTCVLYILRGEVINKEEAEAAGHYSSFLTGGAMRYLYNWGTHKFVCAVSGGTIYISRSWNVSDADPNRDSHIVAMDELSEFVAEHPGGGDVTEIVEAHRRRTKEE